MAAFVCCWEWGGVQNCNQPSRTRRACGSRAPRRPTRGPLRLPGPLTPSTCRPGSLPAGPETQLLPLLWNYLRRCTVINGTCLEQWQEHAEAFLLSLGILETNNWTGPELKTHHLPKGFPGTTSTFRGAIRQLHSFGPAFQIHGREDLRAQMWTETSWSHWTLPGSSKPPLLPPLFPPHTIQPSTF